MTKFTVMITSRVNKPLGIPEHTYQEETLVFTVNAELREYIVFYISCSNRQLQTPGWLSTTNSVVCSYHRNG